MSLGLRIELEEVGNRVIFHLDGRLDTSTSVVLERKLNQLIEEKHLYLLLDFTRVDYLSSAGLRLLLATTKKLKATKGFLILYAFQDNVKEIIRLAGFEKILHICSSEKEALQIT